ncbi:MAG: cytochrome-c peroxidase [Planctomycetota bacterium]|nr:cytochrome-c peroxidase [Planctomycetota bacterium]
MTSANRWGFAAVFLGLAACARPVVDTQGRPAAPGMIADPDMAVLRPQYERDPAQWPKPTLDAGIEHRELGPVAVPQRDTNPQAQARIELGERLFFDGRLSGTGQMACASCHDAELGFGDGRATSFGHGALPLARNAPTLWNVGQRKSWFWDGRANSLEAQADMVLANAREMGNKPEEIVATVKSSKGYRERFAAAFGTDEVTLERILQAIAAFERTLVSDGSSDFDHFLAGDRAALSDPAVRGLHLFRTKARCINCHNGPLFTDEQFHNLGLTYYGRELEDLGRFNVTKEPADVGRFRTPSLRNLGRTGPYMHNGLFELKGVINMYSAGMPRIEPTEEQKADPLFPVKSPILQRLDLTQEEKSDLEAFLMSLTERKRRIRAPELPPIGDA